jgi:hypothetical protein
MIRGYLDRNVWQDLYEHRNGITTADVDRVRTAVRHGRLNVVISMTVLEETFARWTSAPSHATAEIKFILDVAGMNNPKQARVVKEAGDLLNDDIRAYAAGGTNARPLRHP